MTQSDIVQKLLNLGDVLRDDGISYSQYVAERVLPLFIKMPTFTFCTNPAPAGASKYLVSVSRDTF